MYDYDSSETPDVTTQWVYVSLKAPLNAAFVLVLQNVGVKSVKL